MKLLLDECVPERLRFDFPAHEALTVRQAGLKGLKNGALLCAASGKFDVLITVDQNLPSQQSLADLSLALVIMMARSNRYSDLRILVPKVLNALASISVNEIVRIQ